MATTAKALSEKTAAELGIDLPARVLLKFTADQPSLTMSLKMRPHFMIVEDNKIQAYASKEVFARRGADVTLCFDGREALQRLEEDVYDAIFMDIEMPIMSGVEATARIRAAEARTARHTGFSRQMLIFGVLPQHLNTAECLGICRDAGMDRYVIKPLVLHASMFCNMFHRETSDLASFRTAVLQRHWVARYNDIKKMFANTAIGAPEFASFVGSSERRQLDLIAACDDESHERSERLRFFTRQKAEEIASLTYKNEQLERKVYDLNERCKEMEEAHVASAIGKTKEKLFKMFKASVSDVAAKDKDAAHKLEELESSNRDVKKQLAQCKRDLRNTIKTGKVKMQQREEEALKRIRYLEGKNRIIESYLMEHEHARSMLLPENFYANKIHAHTVELSRSYFVTELQELGAMRKSDRGNSRASTDEESDAESEASRWELLIERILHKERDLWEDRKVQGIQPPDPPDEPSDAPAGSADTEEVPRQTTDSGPSFFVTQAQAAEDQGVQEAVLVKDVLKHVADLVQEVKGKGFSTGNYQGSASSQLLQCRDDTTAALQALEEAASREAFNVAELKVKLSKAEETIEDLQATLRNQPMSMIIGTSPRSMRKSQGGTSPRVSLLNDRASRGGVKDLSVVLEGRPAGSPLEGKPAGSPLDQDTPVRPSFSRGSVRSASSASSHISDDPRARQEVQEQYEAQLKESIAKRLKDYEDELQDMKKQAIQEHERWQQEAGIEIQQVNEVLSAKRQALKDLVMQTEYQQLELDNVRREHEIRIQELVALREEQKRLVAESLMGSLAVEAAANTPPQPPLSGSIVSKASSKEKRPLLPKPPPRHHADTTLNLTGSNTQPTGATVRHAKDDMRGSGTADSSDIAFTDTMTSKVSKGSEREGLLPDILNNTSPSSHLTDTLTSSFDPNASFEAHRSLLDDVSGLDANDHYNSDVALQYSLLRGQLQSQQKEKKAKQKGEHPPSPPQRTKQDIKHYIRRVNHKRQGPPGGTVQKDSDVQLFVASSGTRAAGKGNKGQLRNATLSRQSRGTALGPAMGVKKSPSPQRASRLIPLKGPTQATPMLMGAPFAIKPALTSGS